MSCTKKVFVLGMARRGYEAAKLLVSKGYDVVINDAKTEQNVEEANLKDYLLNVKLIIAYGEAKTRINNFAIKCGINCKVVNTL